MHMYPLNAISAALLLAGLAVGSGPRAGSAEQQPLGPALEVELDHRPNIVFILTDDQDLHMNSLDYVPLIRKHLIDKGTLYKRHFCQTAVC